MNIRKIILASAMLMGNALLVMAKPYVRTGTDQYIEPGHSIFVTVSWVAEGGCCGTGSGSALVDRTVCNGASCVTTHYYITVQEAQYSAGCGVGLPT